MQLNGEPDKADNEHKFGGAWTIIKLEALGKYLGAFNRALSKQTFTRIYIDAFAGTGRCDVNVDGERHSIEGSALRALSTSPSFNKFVFIERDAVKIAALNDLKNKHLDKSTEIIQGDANASLRSLCAAYQWKDSRAVLFLDPYGMDVEWATLEVIAKTEAIDVWYLFPYAGLYRQAAKNSDALDDSKVAALNRILGTDEWRKSFYEPKRQAVLFGDRSEGEERYVEHPQMLEYVSTRLKGLFPAVTEPKILYQRGGSKNPSGPPLFALYFAASNKSPKAYGLATKIAKDILDSL
ncbi:three-Cys-motif partner protein TcmP [Bordetella hinzii]|uniref:three-Cys-motif partner protein TcmP n=1 Tax=Bordetella hinzii TaxID=103855 RepID=UPI0039FC039E